MPIELLSTLAMGTRFELVLAGSDRTHLRAAGEEALESIAELHRLWSVFDRESLLSRTNRLAANHPVPVDGETLAILRLARELWGATGGAFDPTLGARMRASGFRGGAPVPADPARSTLAPSPGMAAVELDLRAGTVRFLDPEIELDLGAIAKGYALDRAAALLRAAGIDSALLHGGTSSVVAIGSPPGALGWPIALDREGRLPRVRLGDAALGVSGGGGRIAISSEADGEASDPRGHILDPASARSAPVDAAAAVVADSAAVADAWSTALVAVDRNNTSTALVAVDPRNTSTALVAVDPRNTSTALLAAGSRVPPSTPSLAQGPPRRDPPAELSWLTAVAGRLVALEDSRGVFAR